MNVASLGNYQCSVNLGTCKSGVTSRRYTSAPATKSNIEREIHISASDKALPPRQQLSQQPANSRHVTANVYLKLIRSLIKVDGELNGMVEKKTVNAKGHSSLSDICLAFSTFSVWYQCVPAYFVRGIFSFFSVCFYSYSSTFSEL